MVGVLFVCMGNICRSPYAEVTARIKGLCAVSARWANWRRGTELDRKNSFAYEDLLRCGHGELFGPGNAQLPLPPMLMFDRISAITEDGGSNGKGAIDASDLKSQR